MTNEKNDVYERYANLLKDIQTIDLSKNVNGDGKFSFNHINLEKILDECYPFVTNYGFLIKETHNMQSKNETYNQLTVEAKLICIKTGQEMNSSNLMRDIQIKDIEYVSKQGETKTKSREQEIASTITYFRRYNITTLLGVTGEEDVDGKVASVTKPEQAEILMLISRYNYLLNLLPDNAKGLNQLEVITVDKVVKGYKHRELQNLTNVDFKNFKKHMTKKFDTLWSELVTTDVSMLEKQTTEIIDRDGAKNWKHQQVTSLGTN